MQKKTRNRKPDLDKYPEVGKRIIKAMKHGNITSFSDLAKRTNHAQSLISDRVKGKVKLTLEIASDIGRECGVRSDYLLEKDNYMTEEDYINAILNEMIRSELTKLETVNTYSFFSLMGIDIEPTYNDIIEVSSSKSSKKLTGRIDFHSPDNYYIRLNNRLYVMTSTQWEEYLEVIKQVIRSITVHTLNLLSDSSESIKKQLIDKGLDLRPREEIIKEVQLIKKEINSKEENSDGNNN